MRKRSFALLPCLLLLSGAFADAPVPSDGAPTADVVRDQVLPVLVRDVITDIRMAGLDCDAKPQVLDLGARYMDYWEEPGFYDVSFRTYWKATEDVYVKLFRSGIPAGEIWLLRCGRAGRLYPIQWKRLLVGRRTVPDDRGNLKTVFEPDLTAQDRGVISWDVDEGGPFATRSCWEARVVYTGETLRFFDSPSEISTSARNGRGRPSAPPSASPTTPMEKAVELYDSIDDFISVPKHVYDAVAPFLGDGVAARAQKLAAADARYAGKFWLPRKFDTILGSVERVMDFWKKLGMAEKAGEVGGLVFLGLRDGKSPSEIANIVADTKTLLPDDFGTSGELGYYIGRIVAGIVADRPFSEIAEDLVDFENPDRLGFWGKVGAGLGFLAADAVIGIEKFLNRGERARFEQRMIDGIRKKGYGEEAEKAFRDWLALDDSIRARTPFRLKDEWKIPVGPAVPKPVSAEEEHPCFPCWTGDLYGTCSDPECPNYGNPHSKYKGGGMPVFGPRPKKK